MAANAAGLQLLVELTMRRVGIGAAARWRHSTPVEIAAGLRAQGVDDDLDGLVTTIASLLNGERHEIPDHLVAPLAAFFGAPVSDLTGASDVAETAILERQLVELGAGAVLFCRQHLTRPLANRLLRTVLDVLRSEPDLQP